MMTLDNADEAGESQDLPPQGGVTARRWALFAFAAMRFGTFGCPGPFFSFGPIGFALGIAALLLSGGGSG
jgi:hypothetical protein